VCDELCSTSVYGSDQVDQSRTSMANLEYASTVGRAPGVQQVVFSSADEPLSTVCKLERQDAAVVQVKLVFVRLRVMQHFNIAVFHSETNITETCTSC